MLMIAECKVAMLFIFSGKNIAGIQARHDEMVAEMKECDNPENPRMDSSPQESSTPKKNEKDDDGTITFF